MKKKFRLLEHTADIKFLVEGASLEEIFENSVTALSSYICQDKKLKPNKSKKIVLKGRDSESLLYLFLDEIIYLIDAENFIASKAKVKIKENVLSAELSGNPAENFAINSVKAATYSEMFVKKKGKSWEAQFVIDV